MLGKIKMTASISEALTYNEQKISHGKAECLLAENFIKDLPALGREDILFRFDQRISLNERSVLNIFRDTVTFSPEEKIENVTMQVLAKRYMEGIGFGDQPYLVYRHHDTAHPHMHIVSTNVRADGNLIKVNPKLLRESHQLTRRLEQEFSLVKSQKATAEDETKFSVKQAHRVIYGQEPLKRAISDVLHTVIEQYKYTNLLELNAILRLYNVQANQGSEDSHLYQKRGLLYHAIDADGKYAGKSLKASSFLFKPTLNYLEKKFALNESLLQKEQERVKTAIDWTLAGTPPDWTRFREEMETARISVVVQPEKKGGQEAVFFVDHETKSVFSGQTLGSSYLLEALISRCATAQQVQEEEETLRQRIRFEL
ncbi:MAG TPA: relaxase/mobilization nuclease domain-containing protein [Puia sp.]|jgi:hypothetical protein